MQRANMEQALQVLHAGPESSAFAGTTRHIPPTTLVATEAKVAAPEESIYLLRAVSTLSLFATVGCRHDTVLS